LEIDRRLVNKRITELKRKLTDIDRRRIREIDGRKGLFKICLIGYTNAGKSTLLNALTDAEVFVEDRLFATLDTRTRKWALGRGAEVLLSDTVGFLKSLPHQLIASFKATLEEAVNADLLLHIVDVSSRDALKQIDSVNKVLEELGCAERPILLVFNKVDIVKKISGLEMLQTVFADGLCISAKTGFGLEKLSEAVLERYKGDVILLRISSSQSNGRLQSFLRAYGTIVNEHYLDGSVLIDARLGRNQLPSLKRLQPDSLEIVEG